MYCQKCGALMNDNAKFCAKCGEKVSIQSSEPNNNYIRQVSTVPNSAATKPKGSIIAVIIIIALALVAAVICGCIFLFSNNSVSNGFFGGESAMWDILPKVDFTDPDDLEYRYDSEMGGMLVEGYKLKSPKVRIPDTIEGEPVVGVNLEDYTITELIVPDTVKRMLFNKKTVQYVNYPRDLMSKEMAKGDNNRGGVLIARGISDETFKQSDIVSVYISSGITELPYECFRECKKLEKVYIPNTVKYIGKDAFEWCGALKEVVMSNEIKEIDDHAFGNTAIAEITLPDTLTYIGSGAFAGCDIKSVIIPDSVSYIGTGAFRGCEQLSEVKLPDSLSEIPSSVFYECPSLVNITIPDSVEYIDSYAFDDSGRISIKYKGKTYTAENISELYNITRKEIHYETTGVVETTDFIKEDTAMTTKAAASTTSTAAMTTTTADTTTSTAEIETTADTTSIPEDSSAYTEFRELSMWDVLPEIEETDINDLVFHYDENLKGVVVDGYTGSSDKVRIPEWVWIEEKMGLYAVVAVDLTESEITELIVPDAVQVLSYNKNTVNYINYPRYLKTETVSYLSDFGDEPVITYETTNAFNESNIKAVYIPNGIRDIPNSCFISCRNLNNVYLPDSIETIGDEAFSGCSSLKTINIPKSVISIGWGAFSESGLTSITIPDSVSNIGDEHISRVFYGCRYLTFVKLSESLDRISGGMFEDCTSLETVTIPEGIIYIGDNAFARCVALSTLTLPKNIGYVGVDAFDGCNSLKELTVLNDATVIHATALYTCYDVTVRYKDKEYTYKQWYDSFYPNYGTG